MSVFDIISEISFLALTTLNLLKYREYFPSKLRKSLCQTTIQLPWRKRYHQITLNVIKNFSVRLPHLPTSHTILYGDRSRRGDGGWNTLRPSRAMTARRYKQQFQQAFESAKRQSVSVRRKEIPLRKLKKPRIVHILIEWIIQFRGKFTSFSIDHTTYALRRWITSSSQTVENQYIVWTLFKD